MTKGILDYHLFSLWLCLNGSMEIHTLANILQIFLNWVLKRFVHLFTRIKSFRVMFYPMSVIQLLERLSIAFTANDKREIQLNWEIFKMRNEQIKAAWDSSHG